MDDPWSVAERFAAKEILRYGSTCIYGWFRGDKCLYIGCSSRGLARVLAHDKINILEPVQPDDEIRCIWLHEKDDVLELESILIDQYGPTYNRSAGYHPIPSKRQLQTLVCPRCNRTFKQKQWWHLTCSLDCEPMSQAERIKHFLNNL